MPGVSDARTTVPAAKTAAAATAVIDKIRSGIPGFSGDPCCFFAAMRMEIYKSIICQIIVRYRQNKEFTFVTDVEKTGCALQKRTIYVIVREQMSKA